MSDESKERFYLAIDNLLEDFNYEVEGITKFHKEEDILDGLKYEFERGLRKIIELQKKLKEYEKHI